MDAFQRNQYDLQNSDAIFKMNKSLYDLERSRNNRIIKTEEIGSVDKERSHVFESVDMNLQPSIELSNFRSIKK